MLFDAALLTELPEVLITSDAFALVVLGSFAAEDVPDFVASTNKSIDMGNTLALVIKGMQELMERLDSIDDRI